MHPIILYPIFPALIIGVLNWLYWRKRGHTSPTQLVLGIVLAYVLGYYLLKTFW